MLLNAYTRLVSRWAKHPQWGVNALLPQIPRVGNDPSVQSVAILDDVDSKAVQLDYLPEQQRSLILCVEGDARSGADQGRGQDQQDELVFGGFYIVKDLDVGQARKECDYVMEALGECLKRINEASLMARLGPPPQSADPKWNRFGRVELLQVRELIAVRLTPVAGASYTGVLFARCRGRRFPLTFQGE